MTSPPVGRRSPGPRLGLAAVALSAAIAAAATWSASAEEAGLVLSGTYVRTIIPSRPAAGYFTLTNNGATDRTLVAASSSGCGSVMLHRSVSEGGVEKMLPVDSITVPAHRSITFAPGGFHLMCMSPGASVKPGSSISMTLTFRDGGTVSAAFPVRGVGAKQ